MTDELRAKFEAWFSEGSGECLDWMDHAEAYNDYTHDAMWQAFQAAHASRDAEVEALKRDAEKWRHARDNQGNGLRIIQWDSKAIEELQVMFPSPALSDHFADAAMAKESGE